MRLICGIFRLDGSEAREESLRAMVAQMDVPRLHPALRIWRDGPTGLAVMEFSAHPAPKLPEQGDSVMAADVRLDEPVPLAEAIGAKTSGSEGALLLAVLETYGPAGLDRVLGDFAFASWNRSTHRLICGRDVFGIRPFAYVHQPSSLFAFASFPYALHGSGIIPKKLDEDAIARRMVYALQSDDCLIAGIKRLPGGHFLEVSHEGVSITRYWHLDRTALGSRKCSPREAACELRRLVDGAVACRLPQAGETGAHLSGGLDSSAISVLAARWLRATGRTLHAYSFLDRLRNDISLEDETKFVNAVLEQEGDIDWTPIGPPAAPSERGEPVEADKMRPLGAGEPDNAVCAHAEEKGVVLILSGWGGDEAATFNGRGAFAELFLRGCWRTLAREISALQRERGWPVARILCSEILFYLMPKSIVGIAKRIAGKDPDPQTLVFRSLSSDARKRISASRDEELNMTRDGRENRRRLITSPHIAERAEVWAQTGARHGLAFAFPLLDRRVVEFSLSLPSELFLREGFRRRPFRDAMMDVLPESVRSRHQKYQPFPSFTLAVAESRDELLARIDNYSKNESVRRVIDLANLRRQIEAFPHPERMRKEIRGNDGPPGAMFAVLKGLAAAEYIIQHGE
jgi:asparagine synthase (glutamine-hydrolysing)